MTWSMPRPVLNIVAAVIALAGLGALVMGIVTAPARGRLPGERAQGEGGTAIQATEATALVPERIEGPPPPPELTEEEKAKLEEEKALAQAEAAKLNAQAAAPKIAPPPPPPIVPQPDRVGEILDQAPPAPEEPVF